MSQKFQASPNTPVFVLRINCDGAAFCDQDGNEDAALELARILRNVASDLEGGKSFGYFSSIRDMNGNTCGAVAMKPAEYWTSNDEWPRA